MGKITTILEELWINATSKLISNATTTALKIVQNERINFTLSSH